MPISSPEWPLHWWLAHCGAAQPGTPLQEGDQHPSFPLEREALAWLPVNLLFFYAPQTRAVDPNHHSASPLSPGPPGPASELRLCCQSRKQKSYRIIFPVRGTPEPPGSWYPDSWLLLWQVIWSKEAMPRVPAVQEREKKELGNKVNSPTLPQFPDPRHTPKVFRGFFSLHRALSLSF